MKHLTRIPISMRSVLALLLFALISSSCASTNKGANTVPMSMEEMEVKVLPGDQETTLNLMYTHDPIATDHVVSENEARKKAAILDADVAQLILSYSGSTRRHGLTYRFWKVKEVPLYQGNE